MDPNKLNRITVATLTGICQHHLPLSRLDRQTRASLYDAISRQTITVQQAIDTEVNNAIEAGLTKYRKRGSEQGGSQGPLKRARLAAVEEASADESHDSPTSARQTNFERHPATGEKYISFYKPILTKRAGTTIAEQLVASAFMASPSQETLDHIIARFIDATGNQALKTVACGSCAREMNMEDCDEMLLKDIPNKHHLIPNTPHPAHKLIQDLLIYTSALGTSGQTVNLCHECQNHLRKNKRPRLSLSNDMWIGDIPPQLQNLTLPERLLIAKYFPAAYIVKLFPKHKNSFSWDRGQMYSGLKGNVSTYRLDPRQVASMIDGRLFPPPAKFLSATIGITFVAPTGVRESTMPAMFRVRRWRVREALLWLKANNPLYSDIEISEERLSQLPEDGIPEEIILTAKHSADVESVEKEHRGYVPIDDEGIYCHLILSKGLTNAE